jgi:hypothetical protein
MDPQRPIRTRAARRLQSTPERDVTFQLPAIVSHRLDLLVQRLEVRGTDRSGRPVTQRATSRKELLAALILAAEPDQLQALLERYRRATAGAAMIPAVPDGRWVQVPARSPGIRPTAEQERVRRRGRRPPVRNRYSDLRTGDVRRRARG